MTGKAFAIGEGGMLVTNDRSVYERALALGHYERHGELTLPALASGAGLPWGGIKNRMHQMSSAVGLEQLRKFPAEMAEIDAAMNHFWDLLQGVPGLGEHRPPRDSGSTMGAWYAPHAHYRPEELGGLSVKRFCDALEAEGTKVMPGCNRALHPHALFSSIDIYGHGRPTQGAFLPPGIDNAQAQACLPVAAGIQERVLFIPRFVHFRKEAIERHARAFLKVVEHHRDLLPGDDKTPVDGGWALTARKG
jgi:dTDP-4-amino-4,6-dideoxygalactose transaminase